jgi:hypothetical protein
MTCQLAEGHALLTASEIADPLGQWMRQID